MLDEKKWMVIYVTPRWEKKVYTALTNKSYEVYCPLQRTLKQWKDRKKWVEEPLIKGYLFVHVEEAEKWDLLKAVPGILNYVYYSGKPAIVRDQDINNLRLFLNEYEQVAVEHVSFEKEEEVRIQSGLFMDQVAIIEDIKGKYAILKIPTLGVYLKATLPISLLQATKKKK
jgi:transcription antitermination factor NusG